MPGLVTVQHIAPSSSASGMKQFTQPCHMYLVASVLSRQSPVPLQQYAMELFKLLVFDNYQGTNT